MSSSRDTELIEYLQAQKNSPQIKCVVELLTTYREKARDFLEVENSDLMRGRSKLCRELMKILSE